MARATGTRRGCAVVSRQPPTGNRQPQCTLRPVKIARTGTLTFVNDGGTWRIDAFNLNVERDIP